MEIFDGIWINVNIATMKNGYSIVKDGVVAVKNDLIVFVGDKQDIVGKAKKVHDGRKRWITPGLIDCHTHLIYGGSRVNEFEMRQKGISYAEISKMGGGIRSTVAATRVATENELYSSAEKRLKILMLEGITTVEIKSGYGLDEETEIKMLRVATALQKRYYPTIQRTFLGAHVVPEEFKNNPDGYIKFLCKIMARVKKEDLADAVDAFCETIAFNTSQVKRLFDCAQSLGFPVKLHAEQLSNQKGAILASKYHALSVDHLEFLDEAGVVAISKSQTVAVLVSGSFYYLKETKKPPVEMLRKYGVPISLATDLNPGTSPVNSLLSAMNMACVFYGLTPEEALSAVTKNGAKALGMSDKIGTIEVGKKADFVLWDITHPAELSYGIGLNPDKTVVKNGKCVKLSTGN